MVIPYRHLHASRWTQSSFRSLRTTIIALMAAFIVLAGTSFLGCGRDGEPAESGEETAADSIPNFFTDLRPRSGDVLVPPQIGFRWTWAGAAADAGDHPGGLSRGEFSSSGNPTEGAEAEEDTDSGADESGDSEESSALDESDGSDESDGAGAVDREARPASGGGPDDPEGLAELSGGDQPSELQRVDAYPNGESRFVRTALPEDPLFRVVMVDSIGAIYAQVLTKSSSIRVPLPPQTGPGPYTWHVELVSEVDSSTVARSASETFEIR